MGSLAAKLKRQISHTKFTAHQPPPPRPSRDASEGKGPRIRPQKRFDRRLEEVAKAVWGGYCRLQMPLRPALGVRGTVAGRRLGAVEGRGGTPPPFQYIPRTPPPPAVSAPAGSAGVRTSSGRQK